MVLFSWTVRSISRLSISKGEQVVLRSEVYLRGVLIPMAFGGTFPVLKLKALEGPFEAEIHRMAFERI